MSSLPVKGDFAPPIHRPGSIRKVITVASKEASEQLLSPTSMEYWV